MALSTATTPPHPLMTEISNLVSIDLAPTFGYTNTTSKARTPQVAHTSSEHTLLLTEFLTLCHRLQIGPI